jgi:hypothetical protein
MRNIFFGSCPMTGLGVKNRLQNPKPAADMVDQWCTKAQPYPPDGWLFCLPQTKGKPWVLAIPCWTLDIPCWLLDIPF